MAVTQFPAAATYVFGSTSETGIAVESYEQHDQVDHYEQKNNVGEVVEVITFNPRSELTISGETTSALAQILGKSMTVANLVATQYGGTLSGITICKGVQLTKNRARNLQARITATYYPLVTL